MLYAHILVAGVTIPSENGGTPTAIFFKGGEQLYQEALNLIGMGRFPEARRKFADAAQKGYDNNGLTGVFISILDLTQDRTSIDLYRSLLKNLDGLKVSEFKFGLTDLDVGDLRMEAELKIQEIEAGQMDDSDYQKKGQAYLACAGEFASRLGDKNLKLDEISKKNTMATGNRESLILQAEGYSILGKGTVKSDPKTAAEYMQMAYNFRRQLGDSGQEELNLSKEYAKSAKCWICGRPANGQGIHFMAMKSTVEPVFRSMVSEDIVKPLSEDGLSIYVCMPCYTAISNKSEEISRYYYDSAMAEMRAMEARLRAEISSVRFAAYNSR